MIIRALSLTQPWGTLVANTEKMWETRSWKTDYRGWVGIHAAKLFPIGAQTLCYAEPFFSSLKRAGIASWKYSNSEVEWESILIKRIPLQAFLAVGYLAEIRSTNLLDRQEMDGTTWVLSGKERSFGDFSPNRWALRFERMILLPEPIPCKGNRLLWTPPPDVYRKLQDAIVAKAVR